MHALERTTLVDSIDHVEHAQVGLSAAFGGGIVSSLLLQDPKQAPIALFSHNIIGVTWTVCWWLINYFPFGVIQRLVLLLPFRIVAKVRSCQVLLLPSPTLLCSFTSLPCSTLLPGFIVLPSSTLLPTSSLLPTSTLLPRSHALRHKINTPKGVHHGLRSAT